MHSIEENNIKFLQMSTPSTSPLKTRRHSAQVSHCQPCVAPASPSWVAAGSPVGPANRGTRYTHRQLSLAMEYEGVSGCTDKDETVLMSEKEAPVLCVVCTRPSLLPHYMSLIIIIIMNLFL
ncbi:hypothetical protein Pcinc_035341 [Petrolisthes cinctipes]|uniref:Uncharacterized protein n=1 Tax=Petrolisthes cinctipes TaxID=88211 RepID=A0AAE1EN28_PETCI|nr:hypothetical protein Pcinc_035341 [Petrolisthes cinctipes]